MSKYLKSFILLVCVLLAGCAAGKAEEDHTPAEAPGASLAVSVPAQEEKASGPFEISEVMVKNKATMMLTDGSFPDWVELYNHSDRDASLKGLILAIEGENAGTPLPDLTVAAKERVLIYADKRLDAGDGIHVDFKLSEGDCILLSDFAGKELDRFEIAELAADESLCKADGELWSTGYPTPGYENTVAGYSAFQTSRHCTSPVRISEVRVADYGVGYDSNAPHSDWVELINDSAVPVELDGYYLSDESGDLKKYQLHRITLQPGELYVVLCAEQDERQYPLTGFALNAGRETLYLSDESGVVDYVSLHDIPYTGSYGRVTGENGFFYFAAPTMGTANDAAAYRTISAAPVSLGPDGVFDGVESVTVTLQGEGEIFYTVDGSLPDEGSMVYTEPITVTSSTVVRAISVEEGCMPSPALTLSYLLNEGHSLPVVSIVGDDPHRLESLIRAGSRTQEEPGSISLYENGEKAFSRDCGFTLAGKSSIYESAKKSLKVRFRNAYGADSLDYDLFDTGTDSYDSFLLRAGQDSAFRLFNGEIWQELGLEMSDRILNQHSKFCIVYVNGAYYGIYCMKENISPTLYAQWAGIEKSSVEDAIPHDGEPDSYLAMYRFITEQDMSDPERYRRAAELLDMDSFIDWAILEGVSGNADLFRNVRFFRSAETDGRYQSAFFDLDAAISDDRTTWDCLFGVSGYYNSNATKLLKSLLNSPEFRAAFLRRYGEVWDSDLSTERLLEKTEEFEGLLAPEIRRDRDRWGYSAQRWELAVEQLKQTISKKDWQQYCLERLSSYLNITAAERSAYFS
ncbi:MAG: CotH kinase family protein [Oscillospiraceae bacterium]|nr:CotH kinase family protein [Oscillospiraceae bacterium]